jgi:hypothetical protein
LEERGRGGDVGQAFFFRLRGNGKKARSVRLEEEDER